MATDIFTDPSNPYGGTPTDPSAQGVYWIGADGQVYVKGAQGTNAAGAADANTAAYWGGQGFQQINDPNVPSGTNTSTNTGLNSSLGTGTTYTPAQLEAALTAHNNAVKSINRSYEAGLLSFEDQQNMIRHTRDQSLRDLQTSKDAADNSNSSYFSQISPEAYQSQEGNYSNKILNSYNQGVGDTNTNFNNNQTLIDHAKSNFQGATQDALAGEIAAYNAGGGAYLGKDYSSALNPNVPTLQPLTVLPNGPQMAAPGIAASSPNANTLGGLSTLQAQNKQSDLQKYLNG